MEKIKVLVVEDSRFFRELLVRNLNENSGIEVVATAKDAYEAEDMIIRYEPDVMTLDIELPGMNGLELLKKMMSQHPIRTVVVSTLNDKVFDAIRAGAVDFIAKPHEGDRSRVEDFVKYELPGKIKIAAAASLKVKAKMQQNCHQDTKAADEAIHCTAYDKKTKTPDRNGKAKNDNLIIAIGASTGGTEATAEILKGFGSDLPGIVITQHMPAGFTQMYAQRLDRRAGLDVHVKEAEHGDFIRPGYVYVAPGGDLQMKIARASGGYQIVLEKMGKVNGHCPSVDVLFHSVAEVAGSNSVGIILTGMGGDGAKGLLAMRNAGAGTIGQNEESCVVYGMPKVAYEIGAVEYQEDTKNIAKRTYGLVRQMYKREQ